MTRRPRSRGSKTGAARGPGPRLSRLGASFIALLLLCAGWTYWGPGPAAASGESTIVQLAPGEGVGGVALNLSRAGVVSSRVAFIAAAVASGRAHSLKAGEYEVPTHMSLAGLLDKIHRGLVVRHFVTIPEGFTVRDAVGVLRRADFLTGDVSAPKEGSLLPETYEVRRGDRREAVLARMVSARSKLLQALWAARASGLPYRSAEDAVILASVVEKETAKTDERPRIAAVFINRLRKGMRLESDPTVIYGVSGGVPLGRGLRVSELASTSPYNTYRVAGLPPTPIANPGRAALAAALQPARTDDLFFVADGTGGHVFAATFEAHKRNVAHWRSVEQARCSGAGA